MLDAGVHPGSAAGRALTAQDHSLVALIACRDLLLRAKHLSGGAKDAEIGSVGACVVPGVARNPEGENPGANGDDGGERRITKHEKRATDL